MSSFGRTELSQTGRPIQVAVDSSTEYKSGGITFDWDEVTALTEDTTLDDGTVVKAGDKYVRYGTVVILDDGVYHPADDTDTLVRGETFIVNQTKLASDLASDHFGVIEGGRVYEDRLLLGGETESEPVKADLLDAMPRLVLVND